MTPRRLDSPRGDAKDHRHGDQASKRKRNRDKHRKSRRRPAYARAQDHYRSETRRALGGDPSARAPTLRSALRPLFWARLADGSTCTQIRSRDHRRQAGASNLIPAHVTLHSDPNQQRHLKEDNLGAWVCRLTREACFFSIWQSRRGFLEKVMRGRGAATQDD